MSKWYNSTTKEWYIEGNRITILKPEGMISCVPTVEQLTEWGYEEYIEPVPTPEQLLERAKANKLQELDAYDLSEAVDSFTIDNKTMWLDVQKRQQLRTSIESYVASGIETVTKYFDGEKYTFPCSVWLQMLNALEVYASEALNVTESHRAAINALDDIEDIESYEFNNYPPKLSF